MRSAGRLDEARAAHTSALRNATETGDQDERDRSRAGRTFFGWEMPVPWVNSINPIFIIVLAGVFAALWTKLGPRQPSSPVKFALGTVLMGLAFLLFLPVAGGTGNTTPLLVLVAILLAIGSPYIRN